MFPGNTHAGNHARGSGHSAANPTRALPGTQGHAWNPQHIPCKLLKNVFVWPASPAGRNLPPVFLLQRVRGCRECQALGRRGHPCPLCSLQVWPRPGCVPNVTGPADSGPGGCGTEWCVIAAGVALPTCCLAHTPLSPQRRVGLKSNLMFPASLPTFSVCSLSDSFPVD